MKLRHLRVENYKNLVDFDIDFSSGNGLTMLVGNNGSGKSNVLEVLSAIFANVYSKDYKHKIECTLEYEINGCTVKIKQSKKTRMYFVEGKRKGLKHLMDGKLLPSNIVALYSGEDQRLYRTFYEKFDFPSLRGKMQYIDSKYWDVALLTLLGGLSDEKQFLFSKIGIKNIDHIFIMFYPNWNKNIHDLEIKTFIDEIVANSKSIKITKSGLFTTLNTKDLFEKYKLSYESDIEFTTFDKSIDANFLKDRVNNEGNFSNLNDGKRFFNFFAKMYCDIEPQRCIKDVEIISDKFSLKTLSEGEKKLILIKAIFSFVAYENSLVLLDEPDANIHEERKDDLYKMFLEYASAERQIVVTTHSPILSNLAKDNELVVLENKDGKISIVNVKHREAVKRLFGSNWEKILLSERPLIMCEGKTDIKYLKAAKDRLNRNDLDIDFYDKTDINGGKDGGDDALYKRLDSLSQIGINRIVIGFFDRDTKKFKEEKKELENNVFAVKIPKVRQEEHGSDSISIEHYFKKEDLRKIDENGRRIYLGNEFDEYGRCLSEKKIFTGYSSSCCGKNKIKIIDGNNGKVASVDTKDTQNYALTKDDFANAILDNKEFTKEFDFTEFNKIFNKIREILESVNKKRKV